MSELRDVVRRFMSFFAPCPCGGCRKEPVALTVEQVCDGGTQ